MFNSFYPHRIINITGILIASAISILGSMFYADSANADLIFEPYGSWNGYKVYLSPARHTDTGSRGECKSRNENNMAAYSASQATSGSYYQDVFNSSSPYRNLRARGYKVRIGNGTLRSAIDNSNAWGADLHIPLHSNADTGGQCNRTTANRFGTVIIYYNGSSRGQAFANDLRQSIGPSSPGSSDITCRNPGDPCTTINLGELSQTRAIAGYVEAEYHTWNTGVDWLTLPSWQWRIGRAVDQFLNYPRR